MKSTTVRFADPVYRDLETASRVTGLPINSIVTVACLEWLRRNVDAEPRLLSELPVTPLRRPSMQSMQGLGELAREWIRLTGRPLAWPEPLSPFTLAAQDALSRAMGAAERAGRSWIGTGHLLQGLAEVPEGRAARALARLGVDAVGLTGAEVEEAAERAERPLPTRQVRQVMRHAREEADREDASLMGTGHLLLGLLLAPDSRVAAALAAAGATEAAVREALRAVEPED
jgi:Clp amino terminal domain, pathogenicity island component